jgi:hypothetical protein
MNSLRRLRSLVLGLALVALVTVLTPVWFVHDRASRLRTSRRAGRRVDLPRVAASTIDIDDLIAAGKPVIIEGLAELLGIGDAATPAALRRRAADARFDLALHGAEAPYFLYSGGYGATVSERRSVTVDEFLHLLDDLDDGTVTYQLFGSRSLGGRIAAELDEFDRAIRSASTHRTEPRFSGVWIGSTGVVTPLHHDAWPGILFQTSGRKRVAMYSPADRSNLYFRPPMIGAGRWSELPGRSADADLERFERLRHACRHEGVLAPGDALYIPPFWAHEMEGLEPNVSVPFRFATMRRSYLNPGFLRPASELVRARLAS